MTFLLRSSLLLALSLPLMADAAWAKPKKDKSKETTTESADASATEGETKSAKKGAKDEGGEPKLTEIKDCGVASMDGVFGEARDVQTKLETQRVSLKTARQNVKSALGVATNEPMSTAFEELKKTAGDKLEVAMEGTMPKLKAKDAVPENVQTAIDAVNALIDEAGKTTETVTSLKTNITSIADKAKDFPTAIVSEVKGNPLEAAKASGTVTTNVKAIGEMSTQADKLIDLSAKMVSEFTSAFGSGS